MYTGEVTQMAFKQHKSGENPPLDRHEFMEFHCAHLLTPYDNKTTTLHLLDLDQFTHSFFPKLKMQ